MDMGYKAVILIDRGFQDEEFIYPYYRMLEEGWDVTVASPRGEACSGKYGVPARNSSLALYNALQLKWQDFDLVLIPGGYESPDRLREHENICQFVSLMWAHNKIVAAICHGPWVLISAGICSGRKMTGYKSIHADLKNAGAFVNDTDAVVVDEHMITAQHYRDNGPFMRAVILAMQAAPIYKNWSEAHVSTF